MGYGAEDRVVRPAHFNVGVHVQSGQRVSCGSYDVLLHWINPDLTSGPGLIRYNPGHSSRRIHGE